MIYNFPQKYINKLAKARNIKYVRRNPQEVVEDLERAHGGDLHYLKGIFQYSSKYITLLKPESNFPDKSKTPELFLKTLVDERIIMHNQINREWQPQLSRAIKICSIKHEGSTVYLKFVVGKEATKKNQWRTERVMAPFIVPIAIDFQNELIEVRCSKTELDKYKDHIMNLMGFAAPYPVYPVPKLTKETVEALCKVLSAGIISSHISLSSTVGSVRFNGIKGIDLSEDETLKKIKEAILKEVGLSTNDTMDQEAVFIFRDPRIGIEYDVFLHVDIVEGYFKFKEEVNEAVIDHVKEALLKVTESYREELSGDDIAAKVVLEEVKAGQVQAASASSSVQIELELELEG
jgi:hypothetical protein